MENELKILKSEFQRLKHEETTMKDKIKDNLDKIENNRRARLHDCVEIWVTNISTIDNYRTSLATSSNFLTWMLRPKQRKREQTLIWTPPGSASQQ